MWSLEYEVEDGDEAEHGDEAEYGDNRKKKIKKYEAEAEFCDAVYGYLIANDDRGIMPEKRILLMMKLYRQITERFSYPRFPLYGRETACGLNTELAEDVLQVLT